ncbi:hypothetical protein bcgnr5396_49540 [Bacillus cereus]
MKKWAFLIQDSTNFVLGVVVFSYLDGDVAIPPLKNKKHPLCGHFVLLWLSYTNSNCYVGETNGK